MRHATQLGLLLMLFFPAFQLASQGFDLEHDKFTDAVQILTAKDILTPDLIDGIRKMNGKLPSPVAVGTLNGVTFLYRQSGVALFATAPNEDWKKMSRDNCWTIDSSKDPIEDFVMCWLIRNDFALAYRNGEYQRVVIGRNNYPESEIVVRVDQQAPFRTAAPGFTADQTQQIITQMLSGRSIVTRYQKWPYKANIDLTTDLYGFKEALQFLKWAAAHFK